MADQRRSLGSKTTSPYSVTTHASYDKCRGASDVSCLFQKQVKLAIASVQEGRNLGVRGHGMLHLQFVTRIPSTSVNRSYSSHDDSDIGLNGSESTHQSHRDYVLTN